LLPHGNDQALATPDHYLLLLYVLGTRQKDDSVSFPVSRFDGGSVFMLTISIG
jgi:4,5-DOPA dioxygenase extradiol